MEQGSLKEPVDLNEQNILNEPVDLKEPTILNSDNLNEQDDSKLTNESEELDNTNEVNESEEPDNSKEVNESEEPDNTNEVNESVEPGTSRQINECEEPGTSRQVNESEEPGTSRQVHESEEPGTSRQVNESEEPGTSRDVNELDEPGTSREADEFEEPENFKEIDNLRVESSDDRFVIMKKKKLHIKKFLARSLRRLLPRRSKSQNKVSPFVRVLRDMKDVVDVAEYAEDRLYFVVFRTRREIKSTSYVHFFNTDDSLIYNNYYADFGPLNLGKLYRFCCMLFSKLTSKEYINKKLVYWTILDKKKRANASFLISAFAVIYLNRSPRDAITPVLNTKHPIAPFVDANMNGINDAYTIRIIDCLNGLNRAFYFGLVCFSDFDLAEYETYEGTNLENPSDLSWMVPKKLVAFAGPCGERNGNCPVEFYIGYFKANQIVCVIRLNKSRYDAGVFRSHGIDHFNMYFQDGSTPPRQLVYDFLEIVEKCPGAVAVHCKAGLGRTGCLIGAYLMKHYKMTSTEAISWMRICRPGCVIGAQQSWLDGMQQTLWRAGETYRDLHHGSPEKMRQHKYGIYSVKAKTARENKQDLHSASQYKDKYLSTVADFEKRRQFAVEDLSYFHFKERLKNKKQTDDDIAVKETSRTQGDLLISARLANLKKSAQSKNKA